MKLGNRIPSLTLLCQQAVSDAILQLIETQEHDDVVKDYVEILENIGFYSSSVESVFDQLVQVSLFDKIQFIKSSLQGKIKFQCLEDSIWNIVEWENSQLED